MPVEVQRALLHPSCMVTVTGLTKCVGMSPWRA